MKETDGERNLGRGVLFWVCRQKDGDYNITAVHDEHVNCSDRQARASAKVLKRFAIALELLSFVLLILQSRSA